MTTGTSPDGVTFYLALKFYPEQQRYLVHHNKRLYADPRTAETNALRWVESRRAEPGRVLRVDINALTPWHPVEDLQSEYEHAEDMIQQWAKRADDLRAQLRSGGSSR